MSFQDLSIPSILYQWNKFGRNIFYSHQRQLSSQQHHLNMMYISLIFWLFLCRMVLYECCPGYMKLEGKQGCPAGQYSFISPIEMYFLKRFLVWVELECCYMVIAAFCMVTIDFWIVFFSKQHNFWGVIMSVAHMPKVNTYGYFYC